MTFPVKKLLEVCSVRTGKRDANHGDLGGPYRFFTCAAEPIESPTYSFDGDSIILPGNGANVGLVIFHTGKFEAYQRTYVLGEFNCDARYVYHHLKCFWSRANGSSQYGSATNYIRMGNFEDYTLPVPPLVEQRRIAEVLDRAEALRVKRRAALAQLDSLTQSLFLDLFGDPATNPKGWPAITLGDALVAIRNGANAEQRTEPGGWPITRIETIADGTINMERVRWIEPDDSLTAGFQLQPGDILFSHINSVEHIAKTALYSGEPTPLIHGINLLRLRPKLDSVDPVWLLHLLKHDVVRTHFRTRCKRAVNQASLNQPDIKSLGTFLPPVSLQREFARRVTAVEALKTAQRAALAELAALFATLQHRAFRGEL